MQHEPSQHCSCKKRDVSHCCASFGSRHHFIDVDLDFDLDFDLDLDLDLDFDLDLDLDLGLLYPGHAVASSAPSRELRRRH